MRQVVWPIGKEQEGINDHPQGGGYHQGLDGSELERDLHYCQFPDCPSFGALWAHLLFRNADPFLAAKFILKVAVPCSGMVAAWTGYAKGKVESALFIVALSFILAIFFVPFWMWVLAGIYVKIEPITMFKSIFWIVILPLRWDF